MCFSWNAGLLYNLTTSEGGGMGGVRSQLLCAILILNMITLSRQARDKHEKMLEKRDWRFLQVVAPPVTTSSLHVEAPLLEGPKGSVVTLLNWMPGAGNAFLQPLLYENDLLPRQAWDNTGKLKKEGRFV